VKVTLQSKSVLDDFMAMVNAKNLFVAHSTFSSAAYILSNKMEKAFIVKDANTIHGGARTGTEVTEISVLEQGEQRNKSIPDRVAWMMSTPETAVSLHPFH